MRIITIITACVCLAGCTKPTSTLTAEDISALLKKERAEWEKAHPAPTPTAQPRLTPDPALMAGPPGETEAEKNDRLLRHGFALVDENGQEFLRIYRKDGEPITKGLTPETIAIEAKRQPIYTNEGGKTWDIIFTPREAPSSTPSPSPSP